MIKKKVGCGNFAFVLLFIAGAVWLGLTYNSMKQAEASAAWLSTAGKIDRTWVEESSSTDSDGHVSYSYTPHISYVYTVEDTQYASERVSFGAVSSYGSASIARSHMVNYPTGGAVQVFYDPADPSKAVLVREATGSTIGLIGGGVLVLFSIFGALFGRRRRHLL